MFLGVDSWIRLGRRFLNKINTRIQKLTKVYWTTWVIHAGLSLYLGSTDIIFKLFFCISFSLEDFVKLYSCNKSHWLKKVGSKSNQGGSILRNHGNDAISKNLCPNFFSTLFVYISSLRILSMKSYRFKRTVSVIFIFLFECRRDIIFCDNESTSSPSWITKTKKQK